MVIKPVIIVTLFITGCELSAKELELLCASLRTFIKKSKSFPKQSKLLAPLIHASPRYQEEVKCLPLSWFVMFVQLPC